MVLDCCCKLYGTIVRRIGAIANIFRLSPETAIEFAEKSLPAVLPNGADGWFAMPSLCMLAQKHFAGTKRLNWSSWAANIILRELADFSSDGIRNFCSGQIVKDRFSFNIRTEECFRLLARKQRGDIWIVGAQFGDSISQTIPDFRKRMSGVEFAANTLAVGSILLTDPNYLSRYHLLSAPGDEMDPLGSGSFNHTPHFFRINEKQIGFGALPIAEVLGGSVPVKLFLPE